jgi:hypothetical protein
MVVLAVVVQAGNALGQAGNILVSDAFNRADSTTLGTADTGQVWTQVSGTVGIVGNAGGNTNGNQGIVAINVGVSDYDAQFTTPASSADTFIFHFRYTNLSNTWRLAMDTNSYRLVLIKGGALTYTSPDFGVPGSNDTLRVVADGSTITVYLNGVLVHTDTSNALPTGSSVGWRVSSSTARFDNLVVRSLVVPTATSPPAATATSPPAATATSPPAATATSPPAATATSPPAATATSPPAATACAVNGPCGAPVVVVGFGEGASGTDYLMIVILLVGFGLLVVLRVVDMFVLRR